MVRLIRALLLLAPAWLALGSGPQNGDVAAYLVSPIDDRWVHLPYAAVARAVGPVGLDLVSYGAAAAIVAMIGRRGPVAAVGAAAVVLPWAAFAEVDLPWVALAVAAVEVHPALIGLGVALSPVAALAVPWVWAATRRWEGPLAAAAAVIGLTVASGGEWWTGERGVLHAGPLLIGRGFGLWLAGLPWLVLLAAPRAGGRLPWLVPLALAPTDTPLWLAPALECVRSADGRARPAVALHYALALVLLGGRAAQVQAETALVAEVAREWRDGDGLVAPWTWGARVSVAVCGDPYGIPWHPPGRWLRQQEAAWMARPPRRIWALPPGSRPRRPRGPRRIAAHRWSPRPGGRPRSNADHLAILAVSSQRLGVSRQPAMRARSIFLISVTSPPSRSCSEVRRYGAAWRLRPT